MANRIQLRRGGSQEWRNANPVLAQGEIGIDLDSGRIKIGDGSTAWNSLSYERPVESVANTANSLVQRDSDGNFQAGIITGTLIGNASTATRLSNIRQIQLTQDVVASAVFDGSVNVNLAAQLSTIPSLPHYDGTSTSTGTYTKVVVDAKGRITNASSPTTIQAYGLDTSVEGTGAQPFDNDLRALSQITQTGIAVRSGDGNWTIRQILGTAQQITIANGTGTGANPQLDLAVTSVVPGTYNVESLTSVIALGPNSEPFGTETVNTVKFQVDNRGRLQSSTIVPIATATEGSKYDAYQAGTTYPRYAIIETDNKVYQSIRSIASGGGAPTHTTSDDTGGWRYLAAAAIEQKGLASFAQEDFDVDSNGHVTIAALGVDNTQLQNNRVSFADGNTKEDFELDQELTSTTAYRGFNYLNYVKVNDTSGSLLFSANNVDNDGAGGLDINVDTNISGARIILDRPGTSPLQTIERTAGSFKLHHNVDSAVDRTFDIISNNAGIGGATINITADNDVVLSSTTAENYVKVEDIWFRSNAITSNNSIIIIDPVTEGDNTGTVQIKGNLQVDGITTTVNSTTVTIDDPIITLGGDTAPAVDDNKDRGVEFRYYDSQARLGFFGWDDSYATLATTTGGYRFLYDATNSSEVFSGTDAGIIAGNLRLSSDVESTTTSTGTLAVTGGVGITKRLNVGGNVIFSAELSVTDNVTLNKNVTIVGSNSSATELFKIQNASAVDKFTVDSSSGNTTILGTLGVTNATTLSSTLEVTSNTDLNANLNVASIVRFESVDEPTIAQDDNVNSPTYGAWLISSNDYGSFRFDGGGYVAKDVLFDSAIYVNGSVIIKDSGASGATSTFSTISARYRAKAGTFADNSSGFNASHAQDNNATLRVYSGAAVRRNLHVGGEASGDGLFVGKFNSGATAKFSVLGQTGNTSISGTLGVTNATTLSSTLSVTDNVTLNKNVTIVGSNSSATELFKIQNASLVDKFTVDSSSGNTTIQGIVTVVGLVNANGGIAVDTNKFTVQDGTGNTLIAGTLGVTDNVTLNKNVTIVGSNSSATEFFKIQNASAVDKFTVDSSSGNTTIQGTVSVTDNITLNKNVTIVGSNSSATEFFKIQNASAVDKFTVDSSSGNTTILGTLTASLDSSFNQALGVGGVASFTNNADQTISGAFSNSLAALRVTGGVSIAKNLAVGTNLRVYGTSEFTGVQTLTGKTTHAAQVTITNTSDISAYNTTANTVSLTTQGGFRAEKNAFIGGNFTVYTGAGTANFTVSTDGAATVRQNLTVGGNLIVNGTTTTVNSTTTTLDDPILTLGGDTAPSTDDNKDRGVEFKYFDGSSKVGFFGYDDSLQEFAFLTTATNTSEVFAGTDGTIRAGRVRITGSGTGLDVDANANIDGTLTVVGQIISTVASGAALVIPNTTKINNLNADLLDGLDTSSTDTTGNSVVTRTSGNFSANKITVNSGIGASAGIQGNALTADSLKTARVITVSGVVDGSVSFNGSAAVNITTVFNDADMTALSAQTGTGLLIRTNNATPAYAHRTIVANPTTGSGVTVTNGDGIAGNPTLNILSTTTASANNLVMRDAVGGFAAAAVAVTSLTSTGLISANGGIAVDTNKFTVQDATGNTAIGGTLGVTGATTLSSTLGVTGATTLSSTLGVTGATTLSSTLGVTGATTLSAILNANGGIAVDTSAFTVADTTGNTAIGGTLGVTGATTLSSTLGVTGATTLTSTLGVTGATTLSSTLGVTGATTLSSTLGVTGATTLTGAVTASNTLGVTGATTLSSTLGVTGATTLSSTLGVTGATTLSDILNANGGIAVDTNKFTVQDATGNTAIGGTLTVDGVATLNNSVSLVGSSTNLTVGGDATISGNLIVNGVTTTVNSTTITVDDKNIELGSVASPSDTTADGGGLTLRGLTNKTFNWVESTNAWTSSEHIDIVSTKTLKHGGSIILTDTKQLTNILDITASGNITVGASKFTVLGASGNTNIVGTLGVTGTSTFTGMITANGGITAALVGNADTATKFAATKTFSVTGDATAPAIAFDGSDNVALALTLGTSGVVAGTYTKTTVNAKGLVTAGAAATTTDISEGSNLYYTNARVRNKLDAAYDQLNAMLGTIMSAADLGLILSGTATPGVVVAVGTVASGGGGGGYTSSTSVATTTSSGTASGLTVNTTANSAGAITSFTIDNGGSGYLENTTITIPNPNAGRVRTFSVGGLIEGTGYSVGTGLSTSGTGSGCLVNIDAVSPGGSGASFTVVVDSNGSATVTLASGGSSYFDNEVITLSKTSTYGGPTNITVAVNGVSGSGQILAIDTITNNGNTSERIAGTYTIQPPITVGEGRITAISLPTSSGAGGAGYGVGDVLTIIQLGHTGTAASVPVGTITTNATFEITEVTRMQPGATVTGQTSGTTATLDYAETIGVSPNIQHGIVLTNVNGFFEIGEIVSANNVTNLTLTSYYTP